MLIFKHTADLVKYLDKQRENSRGLGFVPTMGALHKGHLSLLKAAKKDNDLSICSIFVNPTQFNKQTDLKAYPRTIENDIYLLEKEGNDILFLPDENEIYPDGKLPEINFDFSGLDQDMEGSYRPGHFKGVVMVLHRFLSIIKPDAIYMGQKDYQQYLITHKLAKDFHPNTKVVMVNTIREEDGLAMSSRNMRLSKKGRLAASNLYAALKKFKSKYKDHSVAELRKEIIEELNRHPLIEVEYLDLASAGDLKLLEQWNAEDSAVVCIAANVEEIRLIDNLIIS
ncbi:MAG: pantoate--beta-alanine ligase [Chitinophagales bacterium]